METGIQHVERKALQRRRVPQLLYKDSESQEDYVDASLEDVKSEPDEDIVENHIKQEAADAIDPETSLGDSEIKQDKNELDDIMRLINHAATQTNKMIKEYSGK